ncbi:endonuclease/exonuclease/phosphatase family protein [Halpernia frigidisoli]|uniref:Endonuclease/Exonuclease/phosphatase family protein n=1 Tax=Halpernia frigidisoli TaxID=1125876 RepID=A0A1I3HKF1_9FLAO|nr:endonuclease [Halpernia frigidisoli]SFI36152.1 Endonuclease/Exonuclease/phosphatase family protein [Halpernia frigidisoli]
MKKIYLLIFILIFSSYFSQNGPVRKVATIAFLNVENMWDTIKSADYIDGTKDFSNPAFHRSISFDSIKFLQREDYSGPWNDFALKGKKVIRYQTTPEEFTPESPKNYGKKIYEAKLHNIAEVISQIGAQYTKTAPVIVGLIEVENRQVVSDIANYPTLAKYGYGIVHFNSYDARGIDVALLYQKKRFTPTNSLKKEIKIFYDDGSQQYTRDILILSGILDGEKVTFFMNHWPSRLGGEAASLPKRNIAGDILKKEMDSVRKLDISVKLFAMGDFNDDPVSPSIKNHLGAVGNVKDLSEEKPYIDLMYPLYKNGVASLAYRDSPNLFDQIIVSKNLMNEKVGKGYSVFKAEIFAPSFLINKSGNFKGYPFRSWNGDQFTGGYSDHFPAFVILQKEYDKN